MVERAISEEAEEKIVTFGALSYHPRQMANVLGWELKEVEGLMASPDSAFFKLYERGADMAEFVLDKKLFEMAKAGDLKAMEKYEMKKFRQAQSKPVAKGKK